MMEVRIMFSNRTTLFALVSVLGLSAGIAKADFVFGAPVNLGPKVNGPSVDGSSSVSVDELELYFGSYRPGGVGDCDIYVAKRVTTDAEWEEPTNLHLINSSAYDGWPCLSPDGLSLYFITTRGNGAMMVTRRSTKSDDWGPPEIVYLEEWGLKCLSPSFSSDNLEMYGCEYYVFDPAGFGLSDLWVSTRSSDSDAWNVPQNLGPIVNSPAHDRYPDISADGLALFFSSDRPGGYGDDSLPIDKQDIWVTMRATKNDDWGTPMNLGPTVNTSASDNAPNISADGQTLYFSSRRPGGQGEYDLWQAPIIPIVDFNGDGKANGRDVVTMVRCWGENEQACDIGPTPLGDGIVDEQDLFALAEYLEEPVVDPTLIGHWALDETEGMAAADSAGGNDAMVMGNAAWQPTGGKVGGALEFDGLNDFVLAGSPAGLGDGPFSVCLWIKDGAPGQAIVSPQGGVRWLYTNPIDGSLMTDLSTGGRAMQPLFSDVVVTDGQWHRVMLVWDGADRILCVDAEEAAREPLSEVSPPAGKLIIGGSPSLAPGSLWSGLIDDVRIYNRTVRP
jgi:hypothetical protein